MLKTRVSLCLALLPLLTGCGRLSHLAPAGFGGAKPEPRTPEVEALIENEKRSARRGYRPLAEVPLAPDDLPTQIWADEIREELESDRDDGVTGEARSR